MGVVPVLVVVSICVAGGFLLAFLWATKQGQYDDLHAPPLRMLMDDVKKNVNERATTCDTVQQFMKDSARQTTRNLANNKGHNEQEHYE